MNAPFRGPRTTAPKRCALNVGDVVRLVDNEQPENGGGAGRSGRPTGPAVKKHLQVIVEVMQGQAYVAPILTDRTDRPKACALNPGDMPPGILDRPSFLDYLSISKRSFGELQRDVERGKIPKVASCPPGTLLRIRAALRAPGTDLKIHIGLDLRPAPPIGRVLGLASPQAGAALPVAPPPSTSPRLPRRPTKGP